MAFCAIDVQQSHSVCFSTTSSHVTVEDLERNDGSAERPYFMSQNLLTLLKKSNEMPKSVD